MDAEDDYKKVFNGEIIEYVNIIKKMEETEEIFGYWYLYQSQRDFEVVNIYTTQARKRNYF